MSKEEDVFTDIKKRNNEFDKGLKDWQEQKAEMEKKHQDFYSSLQQEYGLNQDGADHDSQPEAGIFTKIKNFCKSMYNYVASYFQQPKKQQEDLIDLDAVNISGVTDKSNAKDRFKDLDELFQQPKQHQEDKKTSLKFTKEERELIKDTVKKHLKDKNISITSESAKDVMNHYIKLAKAKKMDHSNKR